MYGHDGVCTAITAPCKLSGRAALRLHLDELHNLDVIWGRCDACLKQQGPDDTCKTAMDSAGNVQHLSAMPRTTWKYSAGTSLIAHAVMQQQTDFTACITPASDSKIIAAC